MTPTKISEFRKAVYQEVIWRPAAILDLVDALTMAGHVNSPVALSESPVFRRKFSSVYDALVHGELGEELKNVFNRSQEPDWETIAEYEVHAIDATPNERMSVETLAERGVLKAQQKGALRYGHKYSWLVRLVQRGASWVAPEDIERIGTATNVRKSSQQTAAITTSAFWAFLLVWRIPIPWCGCKITRNSARTPYPSRKAAGVRHANTGQIFN